MIGGHLSNSVSDLKHITARTYHKFCRDCLQEAGMLPEQMEGQEYWEKILPEAFASLVQKSPMKYDAVIVDEGQDFRLEY